MYDRSFTNFPYGFEVHESEYVHNEPAHLDITLISFNYLSLLARSNDQKLAYICQIVLLGVCEIVVTGHLSLIVIIIKNNSRIASLDFKRGIVFVH